MSRFDECICFGLGQSDINGQEKRNVLTDILLRVTGVCGCHISPVLLVQV